MISIQVDASRFSSALAAFSRSTSDTIKANRQIGTQLFSWVQRNFEQEGGLQSKPWDPLKPETARQKARLGYSSRLLVRTGNLRQSFAPFSDESVAGVGARASFNVDYAEAHERGDLSRNLPSRPMLPPVEVVSDYASRVYTALVVSARRESGL